jgi:hypothetical protein
LSSILKNADGSTWYVETINWESSDPHSIRKLGLSKDSISFRAERGLTWALGQLYGVMATGIISVEHIFQGLRRPMSVNGDASADGSKLVFTWAAKRDAKMTVDGGLEFCGAPIKRVFFVIVSPNLMPDRYPDIYGWVERWGWLESHDTLSGAPIAYDSRYDTRVWSRD